ncbi:MAG: arginine--tRNA ligase [Desulfovibrio sp.]|nr:arginine--tRNA ligase [Desulfovibrio sp.]MDY5485572.1 arginine--tRNA ligase [Desulfovibrio sp.]
MQAFDSVRSALSGFLQEKGLEWPAKAVVEAAKDPKHGDVATNLAMLLAKPLHRAPRDIAAELAAWIRDHTDGVENVEVAGPGFCNVTFSQVFWRRVVQQVEKEGAAFGSSTIGGGRKTLVEYVSANPTGPLHVGHGRGAAAGDSLARILRRAGYDVTTEYYINDAGRQMRILGMSVWYRLRNLVGRTMAEPEDYYRGSYITDIAKEMLEKDPSLADASDEDGKERCYEYAKNEILEGIKKDLRDFRVEHQNWFSEKTLVDGGLVDKAFQALKDAGYTYEKDGALWFATSRLGDDKDRVLRKSDGSLTYFASDIAYHHNKFERGFDWLIDVWGADHHGYVPRMRAAIEAMGKGKKNFDVVLIQLVNLLINGQPVSMSTRAGTFETLADVVREVGADAARFMFLSRKTDSPVDFDLEAVKQRTMENPVYYVQYAHARVAALLRRAAEEGVTIPDVSDDAALAGLTLPDDMALLRKMALYRDMLEQAATTLSVHHVSHYLMELSQLLHSYYTKNQILKAGDPVTTGSRLALLRAVSRVIANGLDLMGVSAPDHM